MDRLRLKRKKRKQFRKPLAPRRPRAIIAEYEKELVGFVDAMRAAVRERLLSMLPSFIRAAGVRTDAWTDDLAKTMGDVRIAYEEKINKKKKQQAAETAAQATRTFSRTETTRQISHVIGQDVFLAEPNLTAKAEVFTHENVKLIESIDQKYFSEIESTVTRAVRQGQRASEIESSLLDKLSHLGDQAENRARLIARDQINKFNGELNRERQTALGITSYTWSTIMDGREREMHADLDGQEIEWDDPPEINPQGERGHPGDDINCRCTAIPNVESALE